MNLLRETLDAIAESGHAVADIVFIGSRASGHRCTWDEFAAMADVEYDNGYGAQEVANDLEVVFSDGASMTRSEYDGSESWGFSRPFTAPPVARKITRLVASPAEVGWVSLSEMAANDAQENT